MKISKLVSLFLIWRVSLFAIAALAAFVIPVFGNSFPYSDRVLTITNLPAWIWGFGNFDGVHYLRIAQDGYLADYSQAFFPLYPILIKLFAENNFLLRPAENLNLDIFVDPIYFYSGLILSNIFFIGALIMYFKLIKLDFDEKVSFRSVMLLILFPTAFYYGSVYTESLFLLLCVSSIYFLRTDKVILAGILAAFASATKVIGVLLLVIFLVEIYKKKQKSNYFNNGLIKALLAVSIVPSGLIIYSLFLKLNYNDPVYFLTAQPIFGAERVNDTLVLLPQVIFRYLKILATVPIFTLPYFNAFLELIFTLLSFLVLIFAYKRIRSSYVLFTLGCLLIPTLTGTLSSMPRYTLIMFLLFPLIVVKSGKYFPVLLIMMFSIQIVLLAMFIRGYWVA